MFKRLGRLPRLLLRLAGLLALLVIAALWCWLPASPYATLPSGRGPCERITIAENGKSLLAIHRNVLAFWDLDRQREWGAMSYSGHLMYLLTPDGQTVAVAEMKKIDSRLWDNVRIWQPATQPEPLPLPGSHILVDFTADSRFLATQTDQTYKLWDAATGRERPFPVSFERINGIGPLGDGRIVVIDYHHEDGWLVDPVALTLWLFTPELTVASEPIILHGVMGPVTVSPDGRRFTAWQMNWGPNVAKLHDLDNPLTAQLGDLGEWLPHRIKLYDLNTGRELASFDSAIKGGQVPRPVFSPDGSRLLTDEQVLWDITTMPPRKLGSLEGRNLEVSDFSPDGKWLVVHPYYRVGYVFDESWELLDATTLRRNDMQPSPLSDPKFAPRGNTIAAKNLVRPSAFSELLAKWISRYPRPAPSEAVVVWKLPEGQQIAELDTPSCFAYFPDGRSMAVGQADGSIQLWDIPPRRPWWIEYGLPVLFVLLLLLGLRSLWRFIFPSARTAKNPATAR